MQEEDKKIGFFLFEKIHGKKHIASSRIGGYWLIKYWPEAEEYIYGKKYTAIVYQKAYLIDHAKLYDGIKILSICDPDWVGITTQIREMIEYVDAIVTPTEEIASFLRQMTDKPVKVIPDRIDLESYKERKVHKGKATEVVWHGYSHNAHVLRSAINVLRRYNLKLSVISESPVVVCREDDDRKIEERWTKWDEKTFAREFIKSDICIMPGSLKPNDRFKSNNKTTLSWALGVPVATNAESLEKLLEEKARIEESEKRLKEVKEKYDIKISVQEYKDLIEEIRRKKCQK